MPTAVERANELLRNKQNFNEFKKFCVINVNVDNMVELFTQKFLKVCFAEILSVKRHIL